MTPLAASEPYSDEAAAPLTISTWSMSWELMSARPCRLIVPSTMINGPELSVAGHGCELHAEGVASDVAARSRTVGSAPREPLASISRPPATLPSSAPSAGAAGADLGRRRPRPAEGFSSLPARIAWNDGRPRHRLLGRRSRQHEQRSRAHDYAERTRPQHHNAPFCSMWPTPGSPTGRTGGP